MFTIQKSQCNPTQEVYKAEKGEYMTTMIYQPAGSQSPQYIFFKISQVKQWDDNTNVFTHFPFFSKYPKVADDWTIWDPNLDLTDPDVIAQNQARDVAGKNKAFIKAVYEWEVSNEIVIPPHTFTAKLDDGNGGTWQQANNEKIVKEEVFM